MSTSIKQLVDRGLELRRQIKGLKKELDAIEDQLSNAALWKDHEPLADPERDGRRYFARGSVLAVPVIFTADRIIGSFKADSPTHQNLGRLAPAKLSRFFKLQHVFENRFDDGLKFRREAAAELAGAAPEFIDACLARDKHGIPRSDIKIAWDDARDL
jgi:hypothetical protein